MEGVQMHFQPQRVSKPSNTADSKQEEWIGKFIQQNFADLQIVWQISWNYSSIPKELSRGLVGFKSRLGDSRLVFSSFFFKAKLRFWGSKSRFWGLSRGF